MNLFDAIPWDAVAVNLRTQADEMSGVEGGLLGAGLGVVTAVAAMKATGRPVNVPLLLAGAAVGIAYGAADMKALKDGR